MNQEQLDNVEQIIDYKFQDRGLLEKALTHSSSVDNRLESNERLEFLGDAILGQVICQALYELRKIPRRRPDKDKKYARFSTDLLGHRRAARPPRILKNGKRHERKPGPVGVPGGRPARSADCRVTH